MNHILQAFPHVGDKEQAALQACIQRSWLTEGPEAAKFKARLQDVTGSKYVELAPNGTLGLFLALLALDLPRGSEILIPGFTFMATASAAVFAGLKPVLVDVDLKTFSATPAAYEQAITSRTSAIMPVHIYGQAAYAREIAELARRHKLKMVEDAAQACGVHHAGQHAGTFGDIGVISFFADKSVTMGEGGALLIQDEALAERVALLRNQGRISSGSYVHSHLGMNFRVTDMQCAIGNVQLEGLPMIRADRLRRQALYREGLQGVCGIRFMETDPKSELLPFRFPILSEKRDALMLALEANNIQTRSLFYPLHRQPALANIVDPIELPVCDLLYKEGISLPIHQDVSEEDLHRIVRVIQAAS